jgi:hypothetical protein
MVELVEWVAPDGVTTPLRVLYDVSGRFSPPAALEEETVPGQPGGRLRAVRHDVREFVLPIHATSDTAAGLRAQLRELARAMDPGRGEGKVRITAPGGDQREIRCRAVAGLGLDESPTTATPTDQLAPVVFRAHDPYWYASSLTVAEFTAGARPNFFPFFPLRLSAGEVFADVNVANAGDVATWPVWEIVGPGADIALRDLDHGQSTELATTLLAGQTITVDTRPGAKTVVRDDGLNLFPALGDSGLWPLEPGATAVRIEMGGAGDSSVVRLRYLPAYLTA